MKAISLLFTGTVLLANNFYGVESATPIFFEPDVQDLERNLSMRYLGERNLSMRYLRDRNLSKRYLEGRNLSMRYLGERNLSMRYLAVDKSDAWGRSLSKAEKAKLTPITEDNALLWDSRNLSMRYLKKKREGRVRRLRAAGTVKG
jgi:hypothetical protein